MLPKPSDYYWPPNIDHTFIDEMHRRGISVVPFLSNHWDRELGQAALTRREELAEQLAEAVERYDSPIRFTGKGNP